MNSLHNSIASVIITCGYLAVISIIITSIKLINLEKSLVISKEYKNILNVRLFLPILILFNAPWGNGTLNAIYSFLMLQWIFSPINILNYLKSLKYKKNFSNIS